MLDELCRPVTTDPLVIAVCHPVEWWSEPGAMEAAVERLESIRGPDGRRVEVVFARYEEDAERRTARGAEPDVDWPATQPDVSAEAAAEFARMHVALALDLPVDIIDRAPELQWVQAIGAGTDQFVSCGLQDAGVVLTSSAGSNAVGIAEYAMGRVIEQAKRFAEIRDHQRAGSWTATFGSELAGTTLGLIGLGNICSAIVPRARAFGMRVLASRRSAQPGDTHEAVDALYPADQLHEMLGECDAVIAAVPDSEATRGLIDATALAAMKPGAFFCNVGRGTLVDEAALVAALESGHLGGAALDVTSTEPLPSGHPLWTAPNLSLSFHNAAAPETMFRNVHNIFADNVASFLHGEPLRNVVR